MELRIVAVSWAASIIVAGALGYAVTHQLGAASSASTEMPAAVCFRPGPGSCVALIEREIASARQTIDFAAYSLTDRRIVDALNQAAAVGVRVRSVVDRTSLLASSLPGQVWTDCAVNIQHNKTLVIDGQSVGTGSYNFSYDADMKNAENHIWLRDPGIAGAYAANFERLIAASTEGTSCPMPAPHRRQYRERHLEGK